MDEDIDFQQKFQVPPNVCPTMADEFEHDIEIWKQAIRNCKGESAPGVDGFTFHELKMLPDKVLGHLVRIISKLDEFPVHMMLARTVPLPKKGKFTPENSRPITIMATLYCLWARVCASQCLRHLGQHASSAITGMLPGRGAHDASYLLQMQLEAGRHSARHVTGLTLDLRKCFNLLNRVKVRQLLLNHGLPERLVDKWFRSITKLTRYWDVSKTVSQVFPTNNGCPEGDSWSVLAMVCTSETWSQLLQQGPTPPFTSAFADNWSVWQLDQHLTDKPIEDTKQLVNWLGLEINWEKTWLWSTSTQGAHQYELILNDSIPTAELQRHVNATDLGCPMTYHGSAKLGILSDRFQIAKQRLEVLKHCSWVLPLKVHMVLTCILPMALYGAELLAVGQRHLDTLRTQIAEALIGENNHSMNSSIFLHCASKKILEPHVYVTLAAIKAARKFLATASQEMQTSFFHILSQPVTTVGISQGPASALREYLQRLGLRVAKNGEMQVTALRTCHLKHSTFADLRKYILWAWQENLLMFQTQRKSCLTFPLSIKMTRARCYKNLHQNSNFCF